MRKSISILVVVALTAAASLSLLSLPEVHADNTFRVTVIHGINGRSLGLSKELPVVATVIKDGATLTQLNLSFRDVVETDLPAGEYLIEVESLEAGPLPSMTVGPVDIPAGADVRLQARLGAHKVPIIDVK